MKRRSKIGLVILSSFAFVGLSAGVGYAVWSVINIKNTLTPTEKFYTVNFYNGSSSTPVKSLTGLEQDSFFSTPFLSDDATNHTYFTGWKEKNGTDLYKGSISLTLSSFTTIKDYTLNLYASFEKQVTFQVTTILDGAAGSTYTVPVRISDPYLFPMFNLQINTPENASLDNFQYDGKDTTFYFMKREATQYAKTSGKVFNINDALYLGGDKCTASELKAGGSFVLPIQAKFVSKSQTH